MTIAASACDAAQHQAEAACARRLLVRVRRDDQVTVQAHAGSRQHLGREHHAGDPALHVARAAAVEDSVADLGLERGARPPIERFRRHGVDVAVQEQRPSTARPGEARDELRAALETHSGDVQRLALELRTLELDQLGLRAGRREPPGEVRLERVLLPRRVVRFTGSGVEADQVGREPNEVLPPGIDLITDTLLVVGQRHGATIYRQ